MVHATSETDVPPNGQLVSEEDAHAAILSASFDHWCYATTDERIHMDGRPVPLLTTLLHRVCDSNADKFEEVLRVLELAFKAGASAQREGDRSASPHDGDQRETKLKEEIQ